MRVLKLNRVASSVFLTRVVIAEAKTLPGQALETSADRSIPWRQICVETGSGFFKARIIRMVAVHTLKSNLRRRAAADHLAK